VHFHVPVFADPGSGLSTTRRETERLLAAIVDRAQGRDEVPHLEVETYTFDVIPPEERRALGAETLDGALARELQWVLGKLGAS
jgi:hypothetical protein